jgi:DUF4097 and DUF4098 domain-containing protein YvlB
MRSISLLVLSFALCGVAEFASPPPVGAQKVTAERAERRDRARRSSDDNETRIDTTIAFGKSGVVDLHLMSGDVNVTGWTRDEARIVATSERGDIEFDHSISRISLDAQSRHGNMGDTRYELTVPIGTRVIVETLDGDITIHGVKGETETRTTSGEIDVVGAGARFIFESVSGDVRARDIAGDTRGTTVSGDITVEGIHGDIDVGSTSGDVVLPDCVSKFVRIETVNGDITYAGSLDAAGRYEFNTHSGDLRLRFPGDAKAQLSVETFSGDIDSEFPLVLRPGERSAKRSPKRLEFTLGGGGARVTIESFSGDITIERGAPRSRSDQE